MFNENSLIFIATWGPVTYVVLKLNYENLVYANVDQHRQYIYLVAPCFPSTFLTRSRGIALYSRAVQAKKVLP